MVRARRLKRTEHIQAILAVLDSYSLCSQQKSQLQEQIEKWGHQSLFFPKFCGELHWIEYRWRGAKSYTRKNCQYNWPSLVKTVPKALDEIPSLYF